ncbi:hypothetical protein ABZS88_40140 [Streptomyces sp. NPDC005480]|uniref:hypothetical protein n=1 Tax=Streptomyces sp. NPDC005480 TaxID=3154880 RepID=UPI0033B42BAF
MSASSQLVFTSSRRVPRGYSATSYRQPSVSRRRLRSYSPESSKEKHDRTPPASSAAATASSTVA